MSERAATFYQAQAEALDLDAWPVAFRGEVMPLMPVGQDTARVALLNPGKLGEAVVQNFSDVMSSVVPYVMGGEPEPEGGYDIPTRAASKRHVGEIVGKLLVPPGRVTGKLSDFQIEAIAPDEVQDGMMTALGIAGSHTALRDPSVRRVLFVVSAVLWGGPKPQNRVGMAAVYRSTSNKKRIVSPYYLTGRLAQGTMDTWLATR
jgi:hypothetical protein